MNTVIDARGLSCPQPVIMTLKEMKKTTANELIVIVDTDTSKENVSRAAGTQGWKIAGIKQKDEGYEITLRKESKNV